MTKRRCKDCEHLSDMLFAANQREGNRIKELAALKAERDMAMNEVDRLARRICEAEARKQVE